MNQHPNSNVIFKGHTDSMGDEMYNQGLSERRAITIANMLVEKFDISPDRVSSIGHGEAQPIATNDTREERQCNRRVVAGVGGEEKAIEMK